MRLALWTLDGGTMWGRTRRSSHGSLFACTAVGVQWACGLCACVCVCLCVCVCVHCAVRVWNQRCSVLQFRYSLCMPVATHTARRARALRRAIADRPRPIGAMADAPRLHGPLTYGPKSLRTCSGPLPRTVQLNGWNLHLVGCSLATSGSLELLFCIEPSTPPRAPLSTTHFLQRPLPREQKLSIAVSGCQCTEPTFLQHVVAVRCQCVSTPPRMTATATHHSGSTAGSHGSAPAVPFELRTDTTRIYGGPITCTGRLVYGELGERLRLIKRSRSLWEAVGFHTSVTFARSSSVCEALRQIPGVLCEQRGTFDGRAAGRTAYVFEQPVLHAVCLAYARAAGAEFLALADTDDFAPRRLPDVLDAVRRHGQLAGVRLFFDAERACPSNDFCPENETDWQQRCHSDGARKRNHWKPIVLPNRTREVAVHQFWPDNHWLRKQVWHVCYQHGRGTRQTLASTPDMHGTVVGHTMESGALLVRRARA